MLTFFLQLLSPVHRKPVTESPPLYPVASTHSVLVLWTQYRVSIHIKADQAPSRRGLAWQSSSQDRGPGLQPLALLQLELLLQELLNMELLKPLQLKF